MAAPRSPDPALLSQLEAMLRAPDAVLEPGVVDVLKQYGQAGGNTASVKDDLIDNYVGYAQMADLMCQWLEIADVQIPPPGGLGRPASAVNLAHTGSSSVLTALAGPLTAAAAAAAAGASGGAAGLAAHGATAGGPSGGVPDAFTLLAELVRERFDPTQFLSVFKAGPPLWLNALIEDPRGRQLIYELSAAHRNSLLLNYAIRRILKQGHEDEVARVGASLASYFQVYHELLGARLTAVTRATSAAQLTALTAEIAESCVASQHTYVHAQQLLADLARHPGGRLFRRLAQEVEAAAAARHGGAKVYQLQPLFLRPSAGPAERRAVQLVSEVLQATADSRPGAADYGLTGAPQAGGAAQLAGVTRQLAELHELFAPQQGGSQQQQQQQQQQPGLSVEPLRHPRLMQLLLAGMFAGAARSATAPAARGGSSSGGSSQPALPAAELCIQLLALCVSGRAAQPSEDGAPSERRSGSPDSREPLSAPEVAQLLRDALALAGALGNAKLAPGSLERATEVCRQPLAALGLLQHSQALLAEAAGWSDEKLALVLPNHVSLLHRVACEQPGLIPQVLGVLRALLATLGGNRQELSRCVLSFLVSLIVSGACALGLEMAAAWAESADPSLVRFFISLVLESVSPPYSPAFARSMLGIMHNSLILRMKSSHAGPLAEFAAGCSGVDFLPPLSRRNAELLDQLLG